MQYYIVVLYMTKTLFYWDNKWKIRTRPLRLNKINAIFEGNGLKPLTLYDFLTVNDKRKLDIL